MFEGSSSFLFRAIVFLTGLTIVVYVSTLFWEPLNDLRTWFFRAGNLEMVFYLIIFMFVVGYILRKLLYLEWELETGIFGKKKRRRRR